MITDKANTAQRILVVEDNPLNLKITAALVRKEGFVVDMAESAEVAIARLVKNRPDMVITDLHMPGMDGLELTRTVKKNPAWESIVVILLTADNSNELDTRAHDAGCACLINKPIDARLFPGVISAFLGMPNPISDVSPLDDLPIEELRKEFLASGAAECRELLSDFTAVRQFVPAVDFVSIRSAVHRWAGVGGTLGFPAITRQARKLEALIESEDSTKRDELREKLMRLLREFTHAVPENSPAAAPRKQYVVFGEMADAVKPMVLVVDDDPTIRALVKLSLEAAGFDYRLADNGVLACTLARNDPPDAIVLDVDMPRMNGFEVLYALRNQWCTRKIPVILLTARRTEADIVQAAQLGALNYMSKPFEVNDLLTRLHEVISLKEA